MWHLGKFNLALVHSRAGARTWGREGEMGVTCPEPPPPPCSYPVFLCFPHCTVIILRTDTIPGLLYHRCHWSWLRRGEWNKNSPMLGVFLGQGSVFFLHTGFRCILFHCFSASYVPDAILSASPHVTGVLRETGDSRSHPLLI